MDVYSPLMTVLWLILLGYWGLAALNVNQTQRSESTGSRSIHLVLFCGALVLALTNWLRFWPLSIRFLPDYPAVSIVGLIIEGIGVAFGIWARFHLGKYWSGTITIKEDHKLIRTGPYALVRHPIYTGLVIAMFGTAIAIGELRGILAVILVVIAYTRKIRLEERVLDAQFGGEYEHYRREVKALIPFVL